MLVCSRSKGQVNVLWQYNLVDKRLLSFNRLWYGTVTFDFAHRLYRCCLLHRQQMIIALAQSLDEVFELGAIRGFVDHAVEKGDDNNNHEVKSDLLYACCNEYER